MIIFIYIETVSIYIKLTSYSAIKMIWSFIPFQNFQVMQSKIDLNFSTLSVFWNFPKARVWTFRCKYEYTSCESSALLSSEDAKRHDDNHKVFELCLVRDSIYIFFMLYFRKVNHLKSNSTKNFIQPWGKTDHTVCMNQTKAKYRSNKKNSFNAS